MNVKKHSRGSVKGEAEKHLDLACKAVVVGDNAMRDAAEHLAAAKELGVTQKEMAKAVGKSEAWVSALLSWRAAGYVDDTPFGAQAKRKRRQEKIVQATKDSADRIWDDDEEDSSSLDKDADESGNEELQDLEVDRDNANRKVSRRGARSTDDSLGLIEFDDATRRRLLDALAGLTNMSPEQRAQAASKVSRIRKELNVSWDELIVPSPATLRNAA